MKALGHADRVHRAEDVLGIGPVKLKRNAVRAIQAASMPRQKLHDLIFRRHGTALVGTTPGSVAPGAAADQGPLRDGSNPTAPTRIRNRASPFWRHPTVPPISRSGARVSAQASEHDAVIAAKAIVNYFGITVQSGDGISSP